MIKVNSKQYIKLTYTCYSCGWRLVLIKHRALYEKEKKDGKIEFKKVCEKCGNKIMKLEINKFTK